ncbi:MAG: hypothetical protein A07HR60_00220 [uncultured archaeon A07HR60]|nr:MAG: hypothetical protein A07HR60_00220 [uncultured archaeon A07HR60]
MNKHYSDARYYVGRAVAHIRAGLTEDLQPVADRAKERLEIDGPESESSRVQQFRTKVQDGIGGLLAKLD